MEKSRVGEGDELRALVRRHHYLLANGDPDISGKLALRRVRAHLGSSRDLPIYKLIGRVHLRGKLVEERGEFVLSYRHIIPEHSGAVVHPIKMLGEGIYLVISRISYLKDTVSEEARAVVHRDVHILNSIVFTVIISKVLHLPCYPFRL